MLKTEEKEEMLIVYLGGDIDHHSAKSMRCEIDDHITRLHPKNLSLDFREVSFMDSSGIGLVMGRYKLMQSIEGHLHVVNLPSHIKKVMTLAGLDKLAVLE